MAKTTTISKAEFDKKFEPERLAQQAIKNGYLVPRVFDGKVGYRTEASYSECPTWLAAVRKKHLGTHYVAPDEKPLNRLDFVARRGYNRWYDCAFEGASSAEKSVMMSLSMGKNNHRKYMSGQLHNVAINLVSPRWSPKITLSDAVAHAGDLGLIESVYRLDNYDQLICAIAKTGPCVVTVPWYEKFLTERDTLPGGRSEKPWGKPLGMTSMVVSGYSANGLLLTMEVHEPDWVARNFQIYYEDFVDLLKEGGEAIHIIPKKIDEDNLPNLYQRRDYSHA